MLKKALDRYYKELESYKGKADYELAVRTAFQNLLAETARSVGWTLIPEQTLPNGLRPDGTLRDDYFARGYWEAKGPGSDLEKEIDEKIKKGSIRSPKRLMPNWHSSTASLIVVIRKSHF